MPRPSVASPAYINGWRSRTCPSKPWRSWVFAKAPSGMTPLLDIVTFIPKILYRIQVKFIKKKNAFQQFQIFQISIELIGREYQ